MQIAICAAGVVLITFLIYLLGVLFSKDIEFFTAGRDAGFKLSEILLLRKFSRVSRLVRPASLFWSVSAFSNCIKKVIDNARKTYQLNTAKFQQFLAKLYAYRTKIELDNLNKKTIASTKDLGQGQRMRILARGQGVYSSHLIDNGRDIVVAFPKRKEQNAGSGIHWKGLSVSVYLWRKGDASYTFDTTVLSENVLNGIPVLRLAHTNGVLRAQKRKSIRVATKLYGKIFLENGKNKIEDGGRPRAESIRCFLEDISAGGALLRVGGKGVKGVQLRLEFVLAGDLVTMDGTVCGVEYNAIVNQSRLHFECEKIDTKDRNTILSYVYNMLPREERESLDAMELAKRDALDGPDLEEMPDETKDNPQLAGTFP
ncbi:MAG: PilZ domain-containing protein [Treponemataceae bacterium]|nr:MAG: PilZ domain-containing protein [Treponemataceae bacterium]